MPRRRTPLRSLLHVLPAGERWEITRAGRDVALAGFARREDAVRWSLDHAIAQGVAAVVVHGRDYAVVDTIRLEPVEAAPRG